MLKILHIRNFALAENLRIEFQPHLNILTGETGAGKSILVSAIGAVLGERVYTEVIRTGFDKAYVEAIIDISNLLPVKNILQSKGITISDELFLRREISLKSNSRAFVNDSPVTVATLAEIGNFLMDIHGQHEHQSLLRRETHRHLLDALGQFSATLKAVDRVYQTVRSVENSLTELRRNQQELNSKYELYEFQYQEIKKANLAPGEEENLEGERKVLANFEKLSSISTRLNEIFDSEDFGLLKSIAQADQQLQELSNHSQELAKHHDEFTQAKIIIEETAHSVEAFKNNLEFDPQRLEEVESRLDEINRLKKKYGCSIAEILDHQKTLEASLNLQENFDIEIGKLQGQYQAALKEYHLAAGALSQKRRELATRMENVVEKQMKLLGMPNMRFKVSFNRVEDPSGIFQENGKTYFADEFGVDQIEFYISPNLGEDFKPLNKIASGGEISRIMLALKSILAGIDEAPTLIFDEIDSGVSGRIAQAVGRSIHNLSKSHQILCITHLPQIASHGNAHFSVEKFVENHRTFTRILPLDKDQRIKAIAGLMTGDNISQTVLQSAAQLIEESKYSDK